MGPQRVTWPMRLRYRFDAALSRGPTVIMAWLALVLTAVALLAAAVMSGLGIQLGEQRASFGEGTWQAMLRLIDAGTMGGDAGWGLRVVSLIVTIMGIVIAASLIGLVATAFDSALGELRKGRSLVIEDDHTLILGWSPRLFTLLSELVEANANRKQAAIVILADRDKTEMEDVVRSRVKEWRSTKLVCRTGDPSDADDLAMVNLASARSIVVLGDGAGEGDAAAVKAVLAVRAQDPAFDQAHVVVELADPRLTEHLKAVSDRVLPVSADEVIARITAQACYQAGLSLVYAELLDFAGDEIYVQPCPELVGRPFAESLLAYPGCTVIGRLRADGRVELAPPMASTFAAGDAVVVIAADDDRITFAASGAPTFDDGRAPEGAGEAARQSILVVGWSTLGPMVMDELAAFLPEGTTVDIVLDTDLADPADLDLPPIGHVQVRVHPTDDQLATLTDLAASTHHDQAIVLGYRDRLSPAEADARTLLSLLALRRILGAAGRGPRVVVEVLDGRNVAIAEATGADDFVVSDRLSSLLMAQLAENPTLARVFDELFDAGGASIAVRDASHYVSGPDSTFAEVLARAAQLEQVAIGCRRRDGTVRLNPPSGTALGLGDGDSVIVLGTFRGAPTDAEER